MKTNKKKKRKFLKIKQNYRFFYNSTSYANTVAIKSMEDISFHGLLKHTHAAIQVKEGESQNVRASSFS
jgi:hypothetical protein